MCFMEFSEKMAVVFIGIQASGKTTFYEREFSGRGFIHINLDTLKNRNREKYALDECLSNGQSFVVDNTNPTKADRARYILPAKAMGYRVVGCYFRSSVSESIIRDKARERHVPAFVIANTCNRLEVPDYAEGFDELWYVHTGENGGFNIDKWRDER